MNRTSRQLLAVALLLLAPATQALQDDRLQAIEISAERAIRDEKAGYTVYAGDVVLQQGSLRIMADRVTIFHDREEADQIIAVGTPATLRQRPAADKGFVTGSAGRIVYNKSSERVLLREAASIEQDGAIVSGESITYLMAQQRVRADADQQDSQARVQVTIPAAVVEEETGEDPGKTPAPDASSPDAPSPGTTAPDEKAPADQGAGAKARTSTDEAPGPDGRERPQSEDASRGDA